MCKRIYQQPYPHPQLHRSQYSSKTPCPLSPREEVRGEHPPRAMPCGCRCGIGVDGGVCGVRRRVLILIDPAPSHRGKKRAVSTRPSPVCRAPNSSVLLPSSKFRSCVCVGGVVCAGLVVCSVTFSEESAVLHVRAAWFVRAWFRGFGRPL